jgi:Putative adhesin
VSRASVIITLVAVEVAVVIVALYAIGGLHWNGAGWSGQAFASMQHVDFVAEPIAPLDAGSAPQVTIDDPESRVAVNLSPDGRVHVNDLTNVHGMRFSGESSIPQLKVTRTADGVSIVRPWHERFFVMGSVDERIDLTVPAASRVEISHCEGADVSGITGGVNVHSQDGHVTLGDLRGKVVAESDDGYVEADGIRGDSLAVHSSDGHLSLRDVAVKTLEANTNDGRVEVRQLSDLANGTISSDEGSIELEVAAGADLTVDASTSDGTISLNGSTVEHGDSDSAQHTITLGKGTGALRVSTGDGSIHIITNGAQ